MRPKVSLRKEPKISQSELDSLDDLRAFREEMLKFVSAHTRFRGDAKKLKAALDRDIMRLETDVRLDECAKQLGLFDDEG